VYFLVFMLKIKNLLSSSWWIQSEQWYNCCCNN